MLVDGYVRVSQVRGRSGPSFISPSEQADQIRDWTRLHNVQVAEMFVELDESGARLRALGATWREIGRGT